MRRQSIHLHNLWDGEALQNKLRYLITTTDFEVLCCMVQQDHRDVVTIARTSDGVPYLYMLLPSKARARRHARVCSFTGSDGKLSFDNELTTGRHHKIVGTVEHTTGIIRIQTAGYCSPWIQLLNQQQW